MDGRVVSATCADAGAEVAMDRREHLLAVDGMDPEARAGLLAPEHADLAGAPLDLARGLVLRVEPGGNALRDGFELGADLIELGHVVADGREERLTICAGLRRLEARGERRLAGDLAGRLQLEAGGAEPGADRVALVAGGEHLGPRVRGRSRGVVRFRSRDRGLGLRERQRERVHAVAHLADVGFGVDVDHGLCLSSFSRTGGARTGLPRGSRAGPRTGCARLGLPR